MIVEAADCHALILAAGTSQRMGIDKAALPWLEGKLLLEWLVESLAATGWRPFVVLGPHNLQTWNDRLPGATLVLNPDPGRGKTASLAAGVAALPAAARHILITAVDQPRPPALYRHVREGSRRHPEAAIVPDREGHRGHPVVLKASLRPRLLALREESGGLRGLLDDPAITICRLPGGPGGPAWDCNTPAAHREALAWFQALASATRDGQTAGNR